MESRNPVFRRMSGFNGGEAAAHQANVQQLEDLYAAPSATSLQTDRMTYDDVAVKTAALFGVLLVTAAYAWLRPTPVLLWVGLGGGLVLGLVNAFKREPSPALILAYAGFEGLFLGTISVAFESFYNGIVFQAVLATLTTFGVMLALYKSGRIRVTPKFQRILLIAVGGYFVFCLVNLGIYLFTGNSLRGGLLGLLIGAVGAVLASLMLVLDFDAIEQGVRDRIPARYAWTAAFGLAVTLIWLYIEFLRIIAILRGDE
jgi:uncharacterized YccA/Bax inhibitor family protein